MTKKTSCVYKLVQGPSSNYEVQVFLTQEEIAKYNTRILLSYQKDVTKPGFRKGHVPLEIVAEMVDPYYLKIGMLEYIIHDAMKQILDEHKNINFIGYPYDLNPSQLDTPVQDGEQKYIVSFKIDVYPTVVEKNKNWETVQMQQMDVAVSEDQVDEVLKTIGRQYAEYIDTDVVGEHSIVRLSIQFLANDGNEISKKFSYVGEDDFGSFEELKTMVVGKKKNAIIEIPYDHTKLPHSMHLHTSAGEEDKSPSKIVCNIVDIKDLKIPEIDDTFVAKIFGNENIKTVTDLRKQIQQTMLEHRKQEELLKVTNKWIDEILPSFDVSIPQTFIEEEMKGRIEQLKKNFGGEKGWEKFLASMNESKQRAYFDEMKYTVKQSLIKFFVFRTVIEKLGLDVDWNVSLDAENKVYQKLTEGYSKEEQNTTLSQKGEIKQEEQLQKQVKEKNKKSKKKNLENKDKARSKKLL